MLCTLINLQWLLLIITIRMQQSSRYLSNHPRRFPTSNTNEKEDNHPWKEIGLIRQKQGVAVLLHKGLNDYLDWQNRQRQNQRAGFCFSPSVWWIFLAKNLHSDAVWSLIFVIFDCVFQGPLEWEVNAQLISLKALDMSHKSWERRRAEKRNAPFTLVWLQVLFHR